MRERTGSISAQALELLILTGLRTNELIGGQWNEIEWDDKLWIISRERTITRMNHHEVPLSKGALQVLKAQWKVRSMTDDRDYIFPGLKLDQPLSTAAMHSLIKPSNGREPWPFTDPKQGNKTISVHGFRSTLVLVWRGGTKISQPEPQLGLFKAVVTAHAAGSWSWHTGPCTGGGGERRAVFACNTLDTRSCYRPRSNDI
jgi:integrase